MKIIVLFIFCLFSGDVVWSNTTLVLEENFDYIAVSPNAYYHKQKEIHPNLLDAKKLTNWQKISADGFAKPYTEDAYWIKFTLKSEIARTVFLENRYKLLEEYKLYVLLGDSLVYYNDLGYITGGVSNQTCYNPSFKFKVLKDSVYTCYIFLNKTFSSSVLPFKLFADEAFHKKMTTDNWKQGFIIGLILFMMASGISSLLVFKQKIFLYYVLYLLGIAMISFSANGLARYYLWGDNKVLSTFGMYMGSLCGLWFLGKIIFLKLNKNQALNGFYTFFKSVSLFFLVYLVVVILTFLFVSKPPLYLYRFGLPLMLVYPILFLTVCVRSYFIEKNKLAFWFIVIFSITLVYAVLFSFITILKANYSSFFNFNFLLLYEGVSILVLLNIDLFKAKQNQIKLQKQIIVEQEKSNLNFIHGQQLERNAISQKLHDSSAHRISFIKRYVDLNYQDQKMQKELLCLYDEVRNISHELSPSNIKNIGLQQALNQEIFKLEDVYQEINFTVVCTINKAAFTEKFDVLDMIYWTFLELLNNALKHSKATEIKIEISTNANNVRLQITDNGVGYK